jgi:putative endonuclease
MTSKEHLMKDYNFYVYILTNWNNEVMYIGMTNNLERRLYEHKNKLVDGFTKKYNVNKLVYYEHGTDVHAAIAREKEIKKWRREKKNNLVISMNPTWKDLSLEWEVNKNSVISTSLVSNERERASEEKSSPR